ncbi:MAG: FHA domain-containing protein [Pirellulales bacterium]|nr:FHA domain-containing protein [Pirellulales bacterium]
MEVRLKVLVGKNAGQVIRIAGPKFVIGRADDCHLRPRSDLISRQHCALIVEGDYVAIRDFGSKNGTQVNDRRVEGELELADGDQLSAGPLNFEVQVIGAKKPVVDGSSSSDADISDWLSDSTMMDGSTRSLPDQETIELMMEASQTAQLSGEVVDDSEERQGSAKKKKEPGKLPPVPKTSTESSESAAADMLRKLRNLR